MRALDMRCLNWSASLAPRLPMMPEAAYNLHVDLEALVKHMCSGKWCCDAQ